MSKEQENLDSDSYSQVPQKGSSSKDIEIPQEEDNSFESERSITSENGKSVDQDSVTEKKSSSGKGRLLLLFLIIIAGACGYFYSWFFILRPLSIHEKKVDFALLPLDFKKPLPVTDKPLRSSSTQFETVPIKPFPEIIEQTEEPSTLENPTYENKTTIKFLRNEVEFLKAELAQKNTPPSQNIPNGISHISGETIKEESELKIQTSPITSPPVKTKPSISSETQDTGIGESIEGERSELGQASKQSQVQKISPKRSKEIQAYLDFVEDTGDKLVKLIKAWSNRLVTLVL